MEDTSERTATTTAITTKIYYENEMVRVVVFPDACVRFRIWYFENVTTNLIYMFMYELNSPFLFEIHNIWGLKFSFDTLFRFHEILHPK